MADIRYERFKTDSKTAPNAYEIPNKFDVSAKKIRLASMLIREAFEYKLKKEVVLSRPCIYGVFGGRFGGFRPINQKCVGCMRCVQEYPHIMTVKHSKAYKQLGDSFWTPEAVFNIWNEAATGKIPVKGMGYKGSFAGEGFDGIWTDMSEIVRPTRDGVYGREYISTSVEIGRKARSLDFSSLDDSATLASVPVPVIFDDLPAGTLNDDVEGAVRMAAKKLGTYYISSKNTGDEGYQRNLIPIIREDNVSEYVHSKPRLVEYEADGSNMVDKLRATFGSSITIIARLPLSEEAPWIVRELAMSGVYGFHLYADLHGSDYSKEPRHISVALKEVHQSLVRDGLRDQVTIIASGGITLAEHVPKAIISGTDLVAIDTTILVALQAIFQGNTRDRKNCQLKSRRIDPEWGMHRLVNMTGAWHDQLIEILSAMGMRDVRRLRGDIGRSITDSEIREQSFRGISWATQ